jgi:hypothetical protein
MAFPAKLCRAVAGALLLVSPLAAQSPAEQKALDSIALALPTWDSLTDRKPYDAAIMRIEQLLDRNKSAGSWRMLGLMRLAMHERHFVVKQTPYHPAGTTYRRAGMDALMEGMKRDSTFLPAGQTFAQLIVDMRARRLNPDFRESLERAGRQAGAAPVVHLALARMAWSRGDYDQALAAAAEYLVRGGDSAVGAIEMARALAALDRGAEGVVRYSSGYAHIDSLGRVAYREDLAWVATPDELATFDSLSTDSVGAWTAMFWRSRDALEMRKPGERLQEHLRRWVYAHQEYYLLRPDDLPLHAQGQRDVDQWGAMQGRDPFLSIVLSQAALTGPGWKLFERTQWEVDDRGAIYVRHGEPTKRVSSPTGPPNESWMYQRALDRPVFHFLGTAALGTTAATTLVASLPLSPEMLTARGELDPRYQALGEYIGGRRDMFKAYWGNRPECPMAPKTDLERAMRELCEGRNPGSAVVLAALGNAESGSGPLAPGASLPSFPTLSTSIPQMAKEAELRGRAVIREAMKTDGFPLVFDRQLDAAIQMHGMGIAEGEQRRVLAVYSVDGGSLAPRPRPDGNPGWYYPISVRLVALDETGGIVRQLDTVRNYVTHDSLRAGQHLAGYVELPVPPGVYRARVLLQSTGVAVATAGVRNGIDLRKRTDQPVMSDLILGRSEAELVWRFGGQAVPLNPLNAFPRKATATLFYQLSNLRPGTTYGIQVAVRKPQDEGTGKPLLDITSQVTADTPERNVMQSIDLKELKPGPYQMVVRITAPDNTVVTERWRALNILER